VAEELAGASSALPPPVAGKTPPARTGKDKTAWPSHRIARHWLPWILPLLAIALPLLCSIVAASMDARTWTAQSAAASSGRGDLLIPALIVCAESIRRWSYDVTGGWVVATFAIFAILTCGAALITFSDAGIRTSAYIVNTVTWMSIASGFVTGTVGTWLAMPPKEGA
jgi:hypothetical protein